jgi:hypothetical protein
MKRCKTHLVRVCLFLLAAGPAYCQRNTFGIDVGQTSDKFGSLGSVSGLEADIEGQVTVLHSNPKKGTPSIVVGGEIRLPTDTADHAKEFAIFGGPRFKIHNLSLGFNAQIRKIYLPTANVNNQIFVRDKMALFELPLVVRYNFGSAQRAFIQVEGAPEFTPQFRTNGSLAQLPNPNFDHGYLIRGSAGYIFGKWYYAKATYETRYFKFLSNSNNPTNLYNWRSDLITGGVGFVF